MTRLGNTLLLVAILITFTSTAFGQMIVAHRGASAQAPENTLAAMKRAWQLEADAVEGDFYLSRDGHIVCIHDGTTKRTAGVTLPVKETDFAELRKLDVGSWKGQRWAGERIPTLGEMLDALPDGKRLVIEIKDGPRLVPVLAHKLAERKIEADRLLVIAFGADVVAESKRLLPDVKALWLCSPSLDKHSHCYKPSYESVLQTLERIDADGLDIRADPGYVTPEFVQQLTDRGLELHCWTVNDPRLASQFRDLGVKSITTDVPDVIRRGLIVEE